MADSQKSELETKMKAVNRAYKVLNDTHSRRVYDSGLYNKSNVADYFDSDASRLANILIFKFDFLGLGLVMHCSLKICTVNVPIPN